MGKRDVVFQLLAHLIGCGRDLFFGQQNIARVVVEFLGIFQRGGIATRFDVLENAHYGFPDIACVRHRGFRSFFQIITSHCTPPDNRGFMD